MDRALGDANLRPLLQHNYRASTDGQFQVSFDLRYYTLRTLLLRNGHGSPDRRIAILRLDVEGSEWEVLESWGAWEFARIDQLAVELHFDKPVAVPAEGGYLSPFSWERKLAVMQKLLKYFRLLYVGRNGHGKRRLWRTLTTAYELTFLNRQLQRM